MAFLVHLDSEIHKRKSDLVVPGSCYTGLPVALKGPQLPVTDDGDRLRP